MTTYEFLSGMALLLHVGFFRLNHLRLVAHDAMLAGILKVTELPPQCTSGVFWRRCIWNSDFAFVLLTPLPIMTCA
jgi:hypothetical protein